MATPLDLQEQEQLDELKAFWKQYGNLITWVLTLAMLAFAGWNGWNWWQRDQGYKAGALFEELDKAAAAKDLARVQRAFTDLKDRFGGSAYAQQGGLLAAKVLDDGARGDDARAALTWVAEHAKEEEYRSIARLRLAGALIEAKQYDKALEQLALAKAPEFAPLVADRRGDALLAQGKAVEAKAAFSQAYQGLGEKSDYRRLVEAKLTALGAAPEIKP